MSGISVHEVHIMEVEFLSNIRYNMFVSKDEWDKWHVKLSRFARYCNDAAALALVDDGSTTTTTSTVPPPLPKTQVNLPSPLSMLPSPMLPSPMLPSPPHTIHQQQHHRQSGWYQPPRASVGISYLARPQRYANFPLTTGHSRKRGLDEQFEEKPFKRMALSNGLLQ